MPRIYAQVLADGEAEPAFAETFRARYGAIREGIRTVLTAGQDTGAFRSDFDPADRCDMLCALVDGLAMHALSEPDRFPPGRAESLVLRELERLRPATG